MKTINAKGELCPKPLIMTKKALEEIQENESLKILIDNETSKINVVRYLEDNGMVVKCHQSGNVHEILVSKKGVVFEEVVEEYCPIPNNENENYVISFQNDKMGFGSDELGEILMKGFINTLPEATKLPNALIFLNSGINLTIKNSQVLESLKKLKDKGIEILVCGTCLDYFDNMDKLEVGIVSNMYDIIEKLTSADKVIYP